MSNYLDFAPWAATAGGGGGELIQIRDDNKTAQVPYKLFSGQTKSFYITAPSGCALEYSENGTDWRYLTYDQQSRFFESTDALYLNGTTLTSLAITDKEIPDSGLSGVDRDGCVWDNHGNLLIGNASNMSRYDTDTDTWTGSFYISGTSPTEDIYPPSSVITGLAYDRTNDTFMSLSGTTGSSFRYFKIGDTSYTTLDVSAAGSFTISGFCIYGGDLYIIDSLTSTIYQFDGYSNTVVRTLSVSTVPQIARNPRIDFDKNGNLLICTFGSTESRCLIHVLDGFSATVLDTNQHDVRYETGYVSDFAYDPSSGRIYIMGHGTGGSVMNATTDLVTSLDKPCAILMESQ